MKNSFVQKASIVFFLLILPLSCLCKKETAASEPRPNILFIITDDQERREFNCLKEGKTEHGHPRNLSPHMDRLAQEGVVFPNQYVTSPVCTPSRFSVLTETSQAGLQVFDELSIEVNR